MKFPDILRALADALDDNPDAAARLIDDVYETAEVADTSESAGLLCCVLVNMLNEEDAEEALTSMGLGG